MNIKKIATLTALSLLAITLLLAVLLSQIITPRIDKRLNAVTPHDAYAISPAAQALHDRLRIADLHSDTLLWGRNPAQEHARGHVDLPRLKKGGVNLQVFSAVTKSPKGLNFQNNTADGPDDITTLSIGQLWPARTWTSLYERAAYMAERLHLLEAQSQDTLRIIRSAEDLRSGLDEPNILIALLATEGSHPLETDIDNINRLYKAGYRMMGLQHFFDNALGGSMHGVSKGGLTEFGRVAISYMDSMSIIIDVAHSSEAVVRDVLDHIDSPIVLSHGGVRSACPRTSQRNLPDALLLEMAARGSLIGIGYFEGVICDNSPSGIADALIYAVDLLGEDVVALGSDFDGAVATKLDTSELAAISQALLAKDMPPNVIEKVMGENAIAFFLKNLPQD